MMCHPTGILLLCVAFVVTFAKGETFIPKQQSKLNTKRVIAKELAAKHAIPLNVSVIQIPRGGSIAIEDDDGNFLMKKVRNVIRSFLTVGDKKVPIIAKMTRLVLGCVETVSGIRLLPRKEESKKKKSKRKNESKKSDSKQKNIKKAGNDDKKKASGGGQAQSHLAKDLKASNPNYRIQRELKEFMKSPPPNLSVKVGKNIRVWIITMVGTKGSLYEGEKYRLRVQFPANYPTEPPSVYFLSPTPRHEHVYTNGDICLSLLGKDWRPNMTAQSIAMSILSILSGTGRKSLPMDNAAHAQNKPGQKQDDWVYHDDNC